MPKPGRRQLREILSMTTRPTAKIRLGLGALETQGCSHPQGAALFIQELGLEEGIIKIHLREDLEEAQVGRSECIIMDQGGIAPCNRDPVLDNLTV